MPQAPDILPDVAPSTQGVAGPSLAVPTDAFGGAVGAALQHMGSEIEGGANKIWERAVQMQELQNRTEVDNADVEFIKQSALKHAEFNARLGQNASPAELAKHLDEIDALRQNIKGGLSNPMSQRMFDSTSLSTMGRYATRASEHSAQEMRSAYRKGLDIRQSTIDNELSDDPNDPGLRRRSRSISTLRAHELGIPDGQQQEFVDQHESAINLESVSRALDKNPLEGKKMLDDYHAKGVLVGDQYSKALDLYKQAALSIGADQIGVQVTADLKNQTDPERSGPTLQEREQQARDIVAQKYGDIPQMGSKAVDAVRKNYNEHIGSIRDQNWRDRNLVGDILEGNYSPDGKAPTQLDEVLAAPGGRDAVKRLTSTQKQSLSRSLYNNAAGGKYAPTVEGDQQFYKLYGQLTGGDPVARDAAMDVFVPELKLPQDQRNKLRQAQAANHKGTPQDTRITQSMQLMKPSMEGMSVEDRDHFRGAFQLILEDKIRQNNNKSIPPDEVRKAGAALLQNMPSGHWYIPDSRLFEEKIPQDLLGKAKLKAAIEGRDVTDDQLQAEFTRQRYNELQSAAKKTREAP